MDAIFLCRMTKGKAQSVGIEPGRNCRVARSIFTKCVEVGVRSENATKLARYSVVVDMGNRDTSSNDRRPIGWYQKSTPIVGGHSHPMTGAGDCRHSSLRARMSLTSLEPNFSPPSVQAISKASTFLPCNYNKPENPAETRWSRSSHAQP
jgi:hypothetical protein